MTEKPLHKYIDLETYDVVPGSQYRELKEQFEGLHAAAIRMLDATARRPSPSRDSLADECPYRDEWLDLWAWTNTEALNPASRSS